MQASTVLNMGEKAAYLCDGLGKFEADSMSSQVWIWNFIFLIKLWESDGFFSA